LDIKNIKGKEGLFDFSAYNNLATQNGDTMRCDDLKKVVGAFKDETGDTPIHRFVGLRSKMYCLDLGCKVKQTAKGI